MAGGGERNQNPSSNDKELEQHQGRSLYGASGVIHGDSSRPQHRHSDIQANRNDLSNLLEIDPQETPPLAKIETRLRHEEFLSQPDVEKFKASSFPAISVHIGSWKLVSEREGDLVVKIYYIKKKLLWIYMFGSLKRKIEISWSDISAIKASINEGEKGILEIELKERPLFFQEISSHPRKHIQWTTMADFTRGQATISRRHKVECLPGILDKHIEKLFNHDPRLLHLSRQLFPINTSPFFPHTNSNFQNLDLPTGPLSSSDSSSEPYDHQQETERF